MWLLSLAIGFQWLCANFLTQNLFHEHNGSLHIILESNNCEMCLICGYFQNFLLAHNTKCSRGELQNFFQIEQNGGSFMIGCFTVRDEELQLREGSEKPNNFAKMF